MTKKQLHTPELSSWNALTYFNFYRFLIAFLFVSLFWIGQLPEPLGILNANLFGVLAHIFLFFSVIAQLLSRLKTPGFIYQVSIQVLVDITVLIVLMYSSAGVNSGFGMLLLVSVAGGALLCPGIIGVLYAAIASLAVLTHEVYMQLYMPDIPPSYTHAGFLGIGFFSTALLGQLLASRVEESEALAEQMGADLEKLGQINQNIVQRLKSGIIVLDDDLKIRLINESASIMLKIGQNIEEQKLSAVIPELQDLFDKWESLDERSYQNIKVQKSNVELQISLVRVDSNEGRQYIVYLDDVSHMRQSAQNMKLASLGRLTASIAHEIRNPLSAINHAGQLLSESETISNNDLRLTSIIDEHSKRVDQIINNIMSISRRDRAQPELLDLEHWLNDFMYEFSTSNNIDESDVELCIPDYEVIVNIDPSQLRQILLNLVENGVRYSRHKPLIRLEYGTIDDSQRPFLDIIDTGKGLPAEIQEQLFEPFFTTESAGTGLGLYIARELCEANQAILSLDSSSESGSCFRILFPHPDKQHNILE